MTVENINGIDHIIDDGGGISLFSVDSNKPYTWALRAGTYIGHDLKIRHDHANHYLLCPTRKMPVSLFIGCLEEVATKCVKIR